MSSRFFSFLLVSSRFISFHLFKSCLLPFALPRSALPCPVLPHLQSSQADQIQLPSLQYLYTGAIYSNEYGQSNMYTYDGKLCDNKASTGAEDSRHPCNTWRRILSKEEKALYVTSSQCPANPAAALSSSSSSPSSSPPSSSETLTNLYRAYHTAEILAPSAEAMIVQSSNSLFAVFGGKGKGDELKNDVWTTTLDDMITDHPAITSVVAAEVGFRGRRESVVVTGRSRETGVCDCRCLSSFALLSLSLCVSFFLPLPLCALSCTSLHCGLEIQLTLFLGLLADGNVGSEEA